MSKFYDVREWIRDTLIAAELGWTTDTILIKRQGGNIWNQVATAMAIAKHNCVLQIECPSGENTEEADLELNVTIQLNLLAAGEILPGTLPEEDIWQAMVKRLHGAKREPSHGWTYRLKLRRFADMEAESDDGGATYLCRQTFFEYRLSL